MSTKTAAVLHELLAAEKTVNATREKLTADTKHKLERPESFFQGQTTSLKMVEDSTTNPVLLALEQQGSSQKAVTTTVADTLQYYLSAWAHAEDLQYQKNKTNQSAVADLEFRGAVIAAGLPVDELMGLEVRLTALRGLLASVPTQDASKPWEKDTQRGKGFYKTSTDVVTAKMEKKVEFITISPATDKHPAQIKEISKDIVAGTVTKRYFSGEATSEQKAYALTAVDELIVEVKKSRQRANMVPAETGKIADKIVEVVLAPFLA